jgi:Uma2 family endonuclease
MPVSEETYKRVALEDPEGHWELWCGRLRQKPDMTREHDDVTSLLTMRLSRQLDEDQFIVRMNMVRLRNPAGTNYVPDVCVVSREILRRLRQTNPRELDVVEEAVPLVVDVWSSSTGDYDLKQKLRDYHERGDAEIWFIHPYERTLTAWRRQSDGSYTETAHRGGTIQPVALPDVMIAIDTLFD